MDLVRFPVDQVSFDGPVLVSGAAGCIGSLGARAADQRKVPAVALDLSDDRRCPPLMVENELAEIP